MSKNVQPCVFGAHRDTASVKRTMVTRLCMLFAALGACAGCHHKSATPYATAIANDPPPLAHHMVDVSSLPPPNLHEGAVSNGPRIVPRPEGAELRLPTGFHARAFAQGGFTRPRWIAIAPNGDAFVADSGANAIVVLRDMNSRRSGYE
jgi:glucose/arabinose dehydrogenase